MDNKWIVSTDWLADHLDAPDVVIVDASWALPEEAATLGTPYEDYLDERIPGAVFFDIDEIADADSDLPHMLPSPEKFAAHMRRLGIGDGHRVIVYDTYAPMAAPRAWWMFRYFGHDDVAVLDGGLEKWTLEGRPTESGEPRPRQERHFTARPRASLLATLDDVRRALRKGRPKVADARAPGRFCGKEPEPWPGVRSGHMPGAVNLHFARFIAHDGTYRGADEIRAAFAEAGLNPAEPMIFTCGSGVTACAPALAAAIIGHPHHAVYDGSWTEWATRPDTEIVTEDNPVLCEEDG